MVEEMIILPRVRLDLVQEEEEDLEVQMGIIEDEHRDRDRDREKNRLILRRKGRVRMVCLD
jgi:hypothetical protein